eukprot:gene7808-biopygen7958
MLRETLGSEIENHSVMMISEKKWGAGEVPRDRMALITDDVIDLVIIFDYNKKNCLYKVEFWNNKNKNKKYNNKKKNNKNNKNNKNKKNKNKNKKNNKKNKNKKNKNKKNKNKKNNKNNKNKKNKNKKNNKNNKNKKKHFHHN